MKGKPMTYRGKVQHGVVVLDDGVTLPEGASVTVVPDRSSGPADPNETRRSIWQALAELGREAESEPCDLPEDLAVNHDHYLHGLPKRKSQ